MTASCYSFCCCPKDFATFQCRTRCTLLSESWWWGVQLPSEAWLVNIHEPIIWRLHTMVRKLNLGRLSSGPTTVAVAVDPMVHIG